MRQFPRWTHALSMSMFLLSAVELQTSPPTTGNIAIVVLSQSNEYHVERAKLLQRHITDQARALHSAPPRIYLLHEHWPHAGTWTILPIITSLRDKLSILQCSAVMFCHEDVRMNLEKLLNDLDSFDLSEELFIGGALHDQEATIIHHFAFHEDPASFAYPDPMSCFLMTLSLLQSLSERLTTLPPASDFSIDAAHELSMFIWDNGAGLTLTHTDFFCGYQPSVAVDSVCSVWLSANFPHCGEAVPDDSLLVAVKTCHKYHKDRVGVIKSTWESDVKHIIYFSDVTDDSLPTVTLGIPNTERGHCAKLLAILEYMHNKSKTNDFEWFLVVDDDSLVSAPRLRRLLSCYNSSQPIVLGERYGYAVHRNLGYNYVTLGGGMVMSLMALEKLVTSDVCYCPSVDAPDDMTLGMCLKLLHIDITHCPLFHQARPTDYALRYLGNQLPVTFHRHWMIDPVYAYQHWLTDTQKTDTHHEL